MSNIIAIVIIKFQIQLKEEEFIFKIKLYFIKFSCTFLELLVSYLLVYEY